jgi:hypothetical protein
MDLLLLSQNNLFLEEVVCFFFTRIAAPQDANLEETKVVNKGKLDILQKCLCTEI